MTVPSFSPSRCDSDRPRKFSIELSGESRRRIKALAARYHLPQKEVVSQMIQFALDNTAKPDRSISER